MPRTRSLNDATLERLPGGGFRRRCTDGRGWRSHDGLKHVPCVRIFDTEARKGTVCPVCSLGRDAEKRRTRWAVRQALADKHPGARKRIEDCARRPEPRADGMYMFQKTCPGTIAFWPKGMPCGTSFVAGKHATLCPECLVQHRKFYYQAYDARRGRGRGKAHRQQELPVRVRRAIGRK